MLVWNSKFTQIKNRRRHQSIWKSKSNMERNDIILQWELQNSFLSLTGLSTLILGIILIRQIINGRNGFETVMACLNLWLTHISSLYLIILARVITNDYGIDTGSQVIAIGFPLIPIGLITLILISKILNIILTSIITNWPIKTRFHLNLSLI